MPVSLLVDQKKINFFYNKTLRSLHVFPGQTGNVDIKARSFRLAL